MMKLYAANIINYRKENNPPFCIRKCYLKKLSLTASPFGIRTRICEFRATFYSCLFVTPHFIS